ncbi:MAG TPA: hypothetical protein VJI96_05040 [Candidatus Andersenbacteria bacterium]|nr:hypothetical protein [Candidatus Andersenbacteria bacterium]
MFDISFFELVSFVRQVSGAAAGAAGLHGWLLFNRQHGKLSRLLEPAMATAAVVYLVAWLIGYVGFSSAEAHVGISLDPTTADIARSYVLQLPLVIVLLTLLATSRQGLTRAPRLYHFLYFVITSLLISTYAISDHIDMRQVSYVWHGWHSILTLGTVIVIDYLFFVSRHNRHLLAKLHLSFNRFTVFILSGLAIDIMGTYLIFEEALRLDTRFFFMQTVVGILLINGIIFSGPLTRRVVVYLSTKRKIPKPLHAVLGLAGATSLVSWTTITFLDFVPNISLSYPAMFVIYVTLIAGGFMTHIISEGWPLNTSKT